MDIILLEHIDKVGAKHDVVKVKDGYGRNYLLPKGLAIVANKVNKARLDGLKKVGARKEGAIIAAFKEVVAAMAGKTLRLTAKAGESGRLFGSVTAQHISAALKDQFNVDADKRIIEMPDEVKDLGHYEATVKFHPEVEAVVKFEVLAEGAEVVEAVAKAVEPAPVAVAAAAVAEAEVVAEPEAEPVSEEAPANEETEQPANEETPATEEAEPINEAPANEE